MKMKYIASENVNFYSFWLVMYSGIEEGLCLLALLNLTFDTNIRTPDS